VDDHAEPFRELGRLVDIGLVNDSWNRGWTAFTEGRFEDALRWQSVAADKAESQPNVLPELLYDLAVIQLANGDAQSARGTLDRAITLNPKLAKQAEVDEDLAALRESVED
jgi:tetratricopeptide (TPR) repeat protein